MTRKICENCQRPISVCICEHFVSLSAPCEIVILQHPTEQKQALATVPILQACLTNLTVIVGEELNDNPAVQAIIDDPEGTLVIFPDEGADKWDLSEPYLGACNHVLPRRLIVLDGTWRKAKLLWHKNPWLDDFKAVALQGLPSSEYMIRSSSIDGGVSTLEALMHTCNYLSASHKYTPLLKPFKAMIDWQIKKMGKEIFLAHYAKSDN